MIPTYKRSICGLIAALAVAPSGTAAQDLDWAAYHDRSHGCRLEYPAALFTPEPESDQGEARHFSSYDEGVYFRVLGLENASRWTPQQIRENYLNAAMPGNVIYEHTKRRFLVLSGYRGENIFYTKVAVSGDRRTACILDITYPRSLKEEFDSVVTRMSHSFRLSP